MAALINLLNSTSMAMEDLASGLHDASNIGGGGSSSAAAMATVAAVALASLIVVSSRRRSHGTKSGKQAPPVILPGKQFLSNCFGTTSGPYWLLDLCRKHAPLFALEFEAPLPMGPRLFMVFDDRTARKILDAKTSTKWSAGFQFFRDTTTGDNMIAEDNTPRWAHVRKSTNAAFSTKNIDQVLGHIEELLDRWMEDTLRPAALKKEPIDILKEMNIITAGVITKAGFDYDLSIDELDGLLQSIHTCYVEFAQKSNKNIFRMFRATRWMIPGIHRGHGAARGLYKFCEKVLANYRSKAEKRPHTLVHMIDQDPSYNDDGERIRDMIAYVTAGFDTTANTVSFAMLELAKDRGQQEKLRDAVLSSETFKDARCSPAVKRAVRETLRMHPAAALGSGRVVGVDTPVEGTEYVIPAGSVVMMPFYVMQRNPEVYDDPDSFVPDRWEEPTDRMMKCYMPFATGRRNCQGQALAYAEMHAILAKVIAQYRFTVKEEGKAETVVLHRPAGTLLLAEPIAS